MRWIVESFHKSNGLDRLITDLKAQDRIVDAIRYEPPTIPKYLTWPQTTPIIFMGSINLANELKQNPHWARGIWANFPAYDCTQYLPDLGELALNAEHVQIPFGEIWSRRWDLLKLSTDSQLFFRPNTGTKSFSGACIDFQNLESQLVHWATSTNKDELVIVSRPHTIKAEWRVTVAQHKALDKVIGASLYRLDGNETYVAGAPEQVLNFAHKAAKSLKAPPDPMFVVDVAQLSDGSLRVVELNAFSTSAIYAMPTKPIISATETIAAHEYQLKHSVEL